METKNLIIKEATFDDCQYYAEWEKIPQVTEFFSIDESRDYKQVVTEFVKDMDDQSTKHFTIFLKPNKPIGKIYVTGINKNTDSMDITRMYIGSLEDRGQGYAYEALKKFLEYAFINLHMERVTLDYYVGNKAASALYDKLGFHSEGVRRHAAKKNGKYYDLHQMSMLRSDFL